MAIARKKAEGRKQKAEGRRQKVESRGIPPSAFRLGSAPLLPCPSAPLLRCLLLAALCLLSFTCSRRQGPGPLSPEEALRSFHLSGDFRIELFAAEPYVVDPVEVVFDEEGRAFAAEMRDYPEDPPPGKPPRSRIRLLEDTDGDGRVDRSTIFADNLLEATSMLPWKGGLLVTAAPDILYLKDTDGDGKADLRQAVFTGFALVNPESRITNLRFGIDNWIYASNNGQRGSITFAERPEAPAVSVLGADFRFRLDRGLFEAESGPTQFGQAMDDWGHRFITENTVHVRHVILPRRYMIRNPFLPAGPPAEDISDHGRPSARIFPLTGPQHWREVRTEMRQQRYRENKLEQVRPLNPSTEMASGYFSGASGGTVYCGDTFQEKCRGNLFTGDVSANLVHRDILRADGISFVASRPPEEQEREFLASTDSWFRPCSFANAPDGNLYVVDMYREFIETPESVPEELKKDMNFYSGDTLGRIYRIVPRDAPPSRAVRPNLRKAGSEDLVRLLSHPNGWWRLTAQRLLIERQDRSVIPSLKNMALAGGSAQARLHALYALEGMSALEPSLVASALQNPEAGLREHAVRLAEDFPQLADTLAGMVDDPSPRVEFQLALSLGELLRDRAGADRILRALAVLAAKHGESRFFRTAILSSTPNHCVPLLRAILSQTSSFQKDGNAQFLKELALVAGARKDANDIASLLELMHGSRILASENLQEAGLSGLASGLKIAGAVRLKIPSADRLLKSSLTSRSDKVQAAARSLARHLELREFVTLAAGEALDTRLPAERRAMAIDSLAGGTFEEVSPVFRKLFSSQPDPALLKAALQSFSSFDRKEVSEELISRWNGFGPAVRVEVLDALLSHRDRVPALLDAVESGRIERGALDLPRREKLLRNPDFKISARARQILREEPSDRTQVLQAYRPALDLAGDAVKGNVIFEKNCAICHLARKGRRVGPDLSGVSSKTKAQLLEDILNPSKSIQAAYTNYVVITRDGVIHDGLVAAETPGTLTLRRSDSEDEILLRSNVAEIRASGVSLMPDGLEQNMSKNDLADLISYLQGANLRPHP